MCGLDFIQKKICIDLHCPELAIICCTSPVELVFMVFLVQYLALL